MLLPILESTLSINYTVMYDVTNSLLDQMAYRLALYLNQLGQASIFMPRHGYVARNHAERGQLLKLVLLNCATDGVSLTPTYRKPFDMIFQRAKNEQWSGRADLNCRPLAPQASALPG